MMIEPTLENLLAIGNVILFLNLSSCCLALASLRVKLEALLEELGHHRPQTLLEG